jgi:hypothetical protein
VSEVIRQHLHEWLRFSLTIDKKEVTQLPGPNAEIVRQYVAERVAGWQCQPIPLPSSLRQDFPRGR